MRRDPLAIFFRQWIKTIFKGLSCRELGLHN